MQLTKLTLALFLTAIFFDSFASGFHFNSRIFSGNKPQVAIQTDSKNHQESISTGFSAERGSGFSSIKNFVSEKVFRRPRLFSSKCTSSCSSTPKPLKIIIAGAPAAGKGTQCEVIKAKYGVIHLSTGDILRAAVKAGTPLGKKAKEFMDGGKLVPDDLIINVICDRLKEEDCVKQGWLLDGFPRTKSQADALTAAGITPDMFILLDVPEAVLVERVTGRRTDPVTGKIYHMKFSPPESPEVAARLVQRSDDTEEKIKIRYREFQSHITAIRSSYESKMVLFDGSKKASDVSESITSHIDKATKK